MFTNIGKKTAVNGSKFVLQAFMILCFIRFLLFLVFKPGMDKIDIDLNQLHRLIALYLIIID